MEDSNFCYLCSMLLKQSEVDKTVFWPGAGKWTELSLQAEWLFVVLCLSAFFEASDLIKDKINLWKYKNLGWFSTLWQIFEAWSNLSLLSYPSLCLHPGLKQLRQLGQAVLQHIDDCHCSDVMSFHLDWGGDRVHLTHPGSAARSPALAQEVSSDCSWTLSWGTSCTMFIQNKVHAPEFSFSQFPADTLTAYYIIDVSGHDIGDISTHFCYLRVSLSLLTS